MTPAPEHGQGPLGPLGAGGSWARVAAERAAASVAAADRAPVIGIVGADVPRSIVDEWDAVPLVLLPDEREPSRQAVDLLGSACSRPVTVLLTMILQGELQHLSGLIVSRENQDTLRLFYVLRHLAAAGELTWPVQYLELLHLPRASTARYNARRLQACSAAVRGWVGARDAVVPRPDAVSRVGALFAQLDDTRRSRGASGREFVEVLATANALSLTEAEERVHAWTPEAATGRGVLLSGTRTWTSRVHAALEAAGGHVLGEDHAGGSLATSLRPASGEIDDLAAATVAWGPAAATSGSPERATALVRRAQEVRASRVLSVLDPLDQAAPWDLAAQREACRTAGLDLDVVTASEFADDLFPALSPEVDHA